ncbi:hypothetical protein ACWIUD_08565 [Helicobacter sp. 23-1044]
MANVQVLIKCKCGKLLSTRQVSDSPNTKSSGSANCPNCKRRIKWDIVGGKASVYEVGK